MRYLLKIKISNAFFSWLGAEIGFMPVRTLEDLAKAALQLRQSTKNGVKNHDSQESS